MNIPWWLRSEAKQVEAKKAHVGKRRRGDPAGCLPILCWALGLSGAVWLLVWLVLVATSSSSPAQSRPPAIGGMRGNMMRGNIVLAQNAQRPSYLPPPRYTDPRSMRPRTPSEASRQRAAAEQARSLQEAQEYYAEDWIVVGPDGTVVCKDPYVRLQHKYIECIKGEPR